MAKLKDNVEKLEKIKQLESGWDGYKAEPISEKLIKRALEILPTLKHQPLVFPTARKSIQIEYEKANGDYLEFELYEDKVEVFAIISGEEVEAEHSYDDINWNFIIEAFL